MDYNVHMPLIVRPAKSIVRLYPESLKFMYRTKVKKTDTVFTTEESKICHTTSALQF